jgi:membrane-associated phospholipid phosphatase
MTLDDKNKEKGRGWFWRLTYTLGPDLIALGVFGITCTVLMIVYGGKFTFVQSSIILPLVFMLLIMGTAFGTRMHRILSGDREQRREFFERALAMVRDWFPLVLIVLVYENFHDLTDLIRPNVVDGELRKIDELIFGVEPTLALQKITSPWLTEYMTFTYALYFAYPALILGIVYYKDEFIKFREVGLALSLCFYLGLTGYMLVPAIGPRYFMTGEITVPLNGIWLTERAAAAWNRFETVKRDCFPSLHTAITTIALIYMVRLRHFYRGGRWVLWVSTPLIVSLQISTVYLRYHWTIDVFAGWVLAFFCAYAAPWFIRWYYGRKLGKAPETTLEISGKAARSRN